MSEELGGNSEGATDWERAAPEAKAERRQSEKKVEGPSGRTVEQRRGVEMCDFVTMTGEIGQSRCRRSGLACTFQISSEPRAHSRTHALTDRSVGEKQGPISGGDARNWKKIPTRLSALPRGYRIAGLQSLCEPMICTLDLR